MDVLLLSRLQFTATTLFHFLFVPLTLGLNIDALSYLKNWLRFWGAWCFDARPLHFNH